MGPPEDHPRHDGTLPGYAMGTEETRGVVPSIQTSVENSSTIEVKIIGEKNKSPAIGAGQEVAVSITCPRVLQSNVSMENFVQVVAPSSVAVKK
jgi:hypothetical protein